MSDLTVVLVHGAFAESASWAGVVPRLHAAGHSVIAAPNPLRSLSGDAAVVSAVVRAVPGPVLLVGHSYGGAVISNVSGGDVRGLVFVAAFAPLAGESIGELSGRRPGSTLGETLRPVPLADGSTDFFIEQARFRSQFAADVPEAEAAVLAATQRPLRDVALTEPSGPPSWPSLPSWFVFPDADLNIPVEMHREMARRAEAKEIVEVTGASHALTVSRPAEVAEVILRAAAAVG
ncbi:alpha/beta hydrolase [Dactylosporangium sp. NPDC000244]|uniref:alpha/beta fold hydrolase n=1 Tax=Dactylosporangium sp. NPDC000244 TaxID=3154365 RepID=UPI003319C1E9